MDARRAFAWTGVAQKPRNTRRSGGTP